VAIIRDRRVALLCATTGILVIGHFAAYTYIAPLARRDGGLQGFGLSVLLLGYGAAALVAGYTVGRHIDRRPGPAMTVLLAGLAVAVGLLAPRLGPVPTVLATLLWGGAFCAIPVCLSATVLRIAPRARDAASAVYVVSFQIGIGGGALAGERFAAAGHLGALPLLAAGLALTALAVVRSATDVFPSRVAEADHHLAAVH
jgi:predicted MFS family arabinose efflux permease